MERFGRTHSCLELFKACRLCGSGGGYKMPIVGRDAGRELVEPELRHKIRDCCSIDVRQDDKMPPLICELCVDKVNDFFEFREMCRATNSRVRAKLGLPPQTLTQEVSEDCILGVSGPLIYASKHADDFVKPTNAAKRILRNNPPQQQLLAERHTRKRSAAVEAKPVVTKKLRFSAPIVTKPEPKKPPPAPPAPKKINYAVTCPVCAAGFHKQKMLNQHLSQQHIPNVFNVKLGCAPCREWFLTLRLAEDHHKWHKTSSVFYRCDRCSAEFKVLQGYNKHFALRQCIPEEIVPDPICYQCHKTFATENLIKLHKCTPTASVGSCSKCKKPFSKRIQLRKHEKTCTATIQSSPAINPNNPYFKLLRPVQITMSKCDNLLHRIKKEPIDSEESFDTAADLIVKSEPTEDAEIDNPLNVSELKQEIKEEYPEYGMDHGCQDDSDSELESDSLVRKSNTQVESLSLIALRSIFSNKPFKKKVRTRRERAAKNVKPEVETETVANLIITSVQGGDQTSLHPDKSTDLECDNVNNLNSESDSRLVPETTERVEDTSAINEEVCKQKCDTEDGSLKNSMETVEEQRLPQVKENGPLEEEKIEPESDVNNVSQLEDVPVEKEDTNQDSDLSKLNVEMDIKEDATSDKDDNVKSNTNKVEETINQTPSEKDVNEDLKSNEIEEEINQMIVEKDGNEDLKSNENKIEEAFNQMLPEKDDNEDLISNENKIEEALNQMITEKDDYEDLKSNTNEIEEAINETCSTNFKESLAEYDVESEIENKEPNVQSSESIDNQEAINEKSDNDILDLVSDSGDDCNIIDSPDKLKFVEEQLLGEEDKSVDDNILQTETENDILAKICNIGGDFVTNCDESLRDNMNVEMNNASEGMDVDVPLMDTGDAFDFDRPVTTDVEMGE